MAFNINSTPIKKIMLNDQNLKEFWVDNTLVFRDEIYLWFYIDATKHQYGQYGGLGGSGNTYYFQFTVTGDILSTKNANPNPSGRYGNRVVNLQDEFNVYYRNSWNEKQGDTNYIFPTYFVTDYDRPFYIIGGKGEENYGWHTSNEVQIYCVDYPDYKVTLKTRQYYNVYKPDNPIVDITLPDGTAYQLTMPQSEGDFTNVSFFIPVPNRY